MEDNYYFYNYLSKFTLPRLADELEMEYEELLNLINEKPREIYDRVQKEKIKPDML